MSSQNLEEIKLPHIPGLVTQLVLKALKKMKVMTVILLGETSSTLLTHHQPKLKTLQPALQKTEPKLINFM